MSGTSLDGIDVAVVDIAGRALQKRISVVALHNVRYSRSVRTAILAVTNAEAHIASVSRLHTLLAELYAEAVRAACERSGIALSSVDLVGCHGQTIFHDGAGARFLGRRVATTLQIGDGSVLAERIGRPVVSDFRTRDIAAGGAGAPLVPYFDYFVYRDARLGRVALNIGGIANITAIPPGAAPESVLAFDTGPGNMVIDALVQAHTGGKLCYDRGGRLAARGRVNQPLLKVLLRDPYFRRKPPKTAGREQFGQGFVSRVLQTGLPLEDLVSTVTALTGASVAAAIDRFVRPVIPVDELIASGGGVHNPGIMAYLAAFQPNTKIRLSSDFGIDVDGKEAIAFAVLAYETWHRRPANIPSATGAAHPVVLGKVSP